MNGTGRSAPAADPPAATRPASSGASFPTAADAGPVHPVRLARRRRPAILVVVEGTAADHAALVWALREAARLEATVVAVAVRDDVGDGPLPAPSRSADDDAPLGDAVLRAVVETGIRGRTRTAVLDRHVYDALTGAACGADLIVVDGPGRTLLRRPAPPSWRRGAHRA